MNKVQEAFKSWYKEQYYKYDLYPKYHQFKTEVEEAFTQGYKSALAEIGKCEPVAEALHERNRLGYAVVDVIGTLDEIIENAQEVEVDDFLHIAIPIDKWHELQDALEEMPKRAELYTSPISKEWVGLTDMQITNIGMQHQSLHQVAYAISDELKQLNAERG